MAAIKKSEIYSSLWESCDALRGGMDASQYKDYILTLLFVKYVSDKYKGQEYADIIVPEGGSFDDMITLLNKSNIGEGIDIIVAKLAEANNLKGVIDIAKFNDTTKLGSGQEMTDKLTKLVNIFRRDEFNFVNNRADGDDIIGDAYEYLMRKFATESGKSKGQFYTPAEVSRVLAKLIGIDKETDRMATVYDPACGSGSLLIRALNEALVQLKGYGQEKDIPTAGLARMNNVLHNLATTEIKAQNTFSNPQYFEDEEKTTLKRFNYIVANPPFSIKNWTDGLVEYDRFSGYGARPPEKNGDYAWLMHILKSLKSTGKAAVILPHGVLFRGNAEATIRKSIIDKNYIKAIVSLPPNLFYGTGIPACIIVLDKENTDTRTGIFMIDASKGFMKDGDKNRLREQDVYKIIKTYQEQITDNPKYARMVPLTEIKEKNDYNLNIPRYIDNQIPEDIQDITAHLAGGIPMSDIDSMDEKYWHIFKSLKAKLFSKLKDGYYQLNVGKDNITDTIRSDNDFNGYSILIEDAFEQWKTEINVKLVNINEQVSIKNLIIDLAEKIMEKFESVEMLDSYDVYQVLLAYWNDVMADDAYLIVQDGYEAGRDFSYEYKMKNEKTSDGKTIKVKTDTIKSWDGKLIPKQIVIDEYFNDDYKNIQNIENEINELQSEIDEKLESIDESSNLFELLNDKGEIPQQKLKEEMDKIKDTITTDELVALNEFLCFVSEHNKDAEKNDYVSKYPLCISAQNEKGKYNKTSISNRIKEIKETAPIPEKYKDAYEEMKDFSEKLILLNTKKSELKTLNEQLDKNAKEKYAELSIDEIKDLLINKKWYKSIWNGIDGLYSDLAQYMTSRVKELVLRYEYTVPELEAKQEELKEKVKQHLALMGY